MKSLVRFLLVAVSGLFMAMGISYLLNKVGY